MRILTLLLSLLITAAGSAQEVFQPQPAFRQELGSVAVSRAFRPPVSCGAPTTPPRSLNLRPTGFVVIDTCNTRIYAWKAGAWVQVSGSGGSSIDTSNLSLRIDTTASNRYTKAQSDARYLQSFAEADPVWSAASGNYYTKTQSDARYLQSFTELDPTVASHIKSISTGNIADWNSAFTERLRWDGGATGLNAATGRTSLGLGSAALLNFNLSDLQDGDILRNVGGTFTSTRFPAIIDIADVLAAGGFRVANYTGIADNDSTLLYRLLADSRYVRLLGSYANPSWITSLDWAKITGRPTTLSGYGITDATPSARQLTFTAGTGISITGGTQSMASDRTWTITNSAPDQPVTLTAGANVTITGTYPSFTISASGGGGGGSGTVTSVATNNGTGITGGPITTSGTLAIDTFKISTKDNVRKVADSLGVLIAKDPLIHRYIPMGLTMVGYNTLRDPLDITSVSNMVDNRIDFTAIYIPTAATVTGVGYYVGTAGNYTGDQTNSIALYSYSGGTLTKVAETSNSEAHFEGTSNTWRQVAFSTPYAAAAGTYFIGFLANWSGTATATPQIGGFNLSNAAASGSGGTLFANSAKTASGAAGQNSQPATIAASAAGGINTVRACYVY